MSFKNNELCKKTKNIKSVKCPVDITPPQPLRAD